MTEKLSDEARRESVERASLDAYSHEKVRDRYDADLMMAGFEDGAEWQAARDQERIAALEDEVERLRDALTGIKERDAEVGEDESWWIGGAWGEYGEPVVPLRILSYVIDGNLDEKVASIDPGFAITYAEQVARADAAEALLARIREFVTERIDGYPDDPYDFVREFALGVHAILDGDSNADDS